MKKIDIEQYFGRIKHLDIARTDEEVLSRTIEMMEEKSHSYHHFANERDYDNAQKYFDQVKILYDLILFITDQ
jgi:hypothetical protein